jgi:hypothetical protein
MNEEEEEAVDGVAFVNVDIDNDSTTSTTAQVPVPLLPSDEVAEVLLDLRRVGSSSER